MFLLATFHPPFSIAPCMKTMTEKMQQQKKSASESRGKILRGVVVSDKMKDTASVLVTRFVKHPQYGKFMKHGKKYLAHDPGNAHHTGEKVFIRETRPISKRKNFKIVDSF